MAYVADGYVATGYVAGQTTTLAVTTNAATSVGTNDAQLNGTLDNLGGASSVDVSFEWRQAGASTWNSTATQSRSSTGSFSEVLSGLSDGVDYEYRSVADDGTTVVTGAIVTFTTSAATGASIAFTGGNAVQLDDGTPVENATVYAVEVGVSASPATASTDANGEATISGLQSGVLYRTFAVKDIDSDGRLEGTSDIYRTAS